MIIIEVRGQPAPQGSKRPSRAGGKPDGKILMVESSKAVGPWREAVRAETQRAMAGTAPLAGPVLVSVTFQLARPRSHYRSGRYAALLKDSAPGFHTGRPDLDKLLRAVLDGLTAGGAWDDDGQVAMVEAAKRYGTPGCRIEVKEL